MAEGGEGDSSLIVASVPEGQRKLMCILYPGFVDNVDRAINSLGGMKTIEKVYYEKTHVLEARLRPEDRFCKPVVGRSLPVTNLVLRVRRRRGRSSREGEKGGEVGQSGERSSGPDTQVEVLGMVRLTYQFKGMADFQVLPPGLNQVPYKAEPLDPSIFQISEPFYDAFEDRGVPLFLPPWAFSKFDKPSNYASRPDFQHKVTGNQVPGSSRQRRQVFAIGITFDHKGPVPSKSHPDLPEVPALHQTKLEAVKKLFEERPIWSRGWIQYKTKLPNVIVRSLLALVSYYFTNGPWKMLWVRLGYDPRSTPESKRYQCLDYRLPREIAAVSTLEARRSKLRKGLIYAGSKKQEEFQLSGDSVQLAEATADASAPETEACPVFTADQLPTQRQVYYQLCDLRDESLQTLIHGNDGREDECSEANGWCEEGVYDQLRKMLGEMVRRTAERVEEERRLALQTVPDPARD